MREQTPLALLLLTFAASAQTPQLQTRLEGQVVDPVHQPVANAMVVVEHDGVVVGTTRTDGQGIFVFPKIPAQYVVVRATTDVPDIGAVMVDLWGEGRGFARVRTMPARKLSGTVRDDTGDPVAGAWVLASPSSNQDLAHAHCRGRSDAEGHYELTHVAMGPVNVRAWTSQHDAECFTATIDGHTDATLDCTVTRDAADWVTFLLEDATEEQRARAKLRVLAFNRRGQVPLPPELTRPAAVEPGEWKVCGWTRADELRAWVVLDGATMWPGEHVVQKGLGSTKRRFMVGDEDGALRGSLRRADGTPAAGIALLLQPTDHFSALNSLRRATITGADGTFTMQAPVNRDVDFAMRSMTPSTVLAGNAPNAVWFVAKHFADQRWDLETRPGHSVRLHLDDANGTQARGAQAVLSTIDGNTRMVVGTGLSGIDGSVEISCLALDMPAQLLVTARGPGGTGQLERDVKTGPDVYLGRIKLEPAASIRGVIVDSDGVPAPGARLSVQGNYRRGAFVLAANRAGQFHVPGLAPGNYRLRLFGTPRAQVAQVEIVQVQAGETTDVTLMINE